MDKQYTQGEQEKMKKYRDLFNARNELHKLLRRVVVSTKIGKQKKQPDDDITLAIGKDSLCSCRRYEQVRYYPNNFMREYEFDDDLETITYLIGEINKRFQRFRKARNSHKLEYANCKRRFAQKFFEAPLTRINEIYSDKK